MKAIVQRRAGPPEVLKLREVEKPAPRADEVLIKIRAATVTRGDTVLRAMPGVMMIFMRLFMGLHRKPIPGSELAGEVVEVGAEVERFTPGDLVFGMTGMSNVGSYAEYSCLPETAALAIKPADLSFEEAAAIPVGGTTALHFLRLAGDIEGKSALIYGASGSVGSYAVQIARQLGAQVTGVCSTRNIELVASLGAERVIDYTVDDFRESEQMYDVIFDAVGKISRADCQEILVTGGSFLSVGKGLADGSLEQLLVIRDMAEAGAVRPVIDRRYPIERAAEAHRYVEGGHKVGNVVLVVDHDGA